VRGEHFHNDGQGETIFLRRLPDAQWAFARFAKRPRIVPLPQFAAALGMCGALYGDH
jgi:hypothetical protein